ncbi:Sporulation related domain-containing protein [Modicisalibacter muralis]|uniref:Sporulation related domain-containing protein n=1 Tax=Modicisalibacter muralis TaxID=119000 RepID=A0A1G9JTR6_9GAMM|nr:SPOR domain-containing protein [Halomonas muralis]SDL40772.1 Sporulation related domain-containing protein [Halomonas muralis]
MARRPAQKSTRRAAPKGATTRRAPRQQQGRLSIPGWLWGLAGLIAGFALSQYFQQTAPPVATVVPKPPSSATAPAAEETAAASGESQSEAPTKPRMPTFEFYTLLPESEVIAPKVEAYHSTPRPQADTESGEAADGTASAGSFMLQAASFQDANDAQRLAGRLEDLGLLAKITTVKANGNQTWHRVQVGPYQDTRELSRARDLMVTQGIEPLLIKLQN